MKNLKILIKNLKPVVSRTFQIIWSLILKCMILTTGAENTTKTIQMVKYMLFLSTVI